MNASTMHQLIDLNRQFYQTFARQFSATRQRLQPGVWKILSSLPLSTRILDLGCGNGELWGELARGGFSGAYAGLDFSPELLEVARCGLPAEILPGGPQAAFLQADLSDPNWEASLARLSRSLSPPYDFVLAFALLHHLPGTSLREQVLKKVHLLLTPGGKFIHSNWQFLKSPRLRARIQPWEAAGLRAEEVEPGDYLLDWRQGGRGLRYAHHFSPEELAALAEETGFQILETFTSDGEGGELGLYQVWGKRET